MGDGRALRRHLGGAAVFLALLSVVVVVPLVAEADPAGAHRRTVKRCAFDPFAGQQCWYVSVPHTHPKPTTPPTTQPPPTTAPPPLTTCGNGGASGQGDASGDCNIVEPPPTTPPTTQPPPTTAPPPLTTCGSGGASGQGDASGDCNIVEPPPECRSGHHNHDNRGCHPQSDTHCLSGYHTHDGRRCHPERESHCPQGRQAQGQAPLHTCPDDDTDDQDDSDEDNSDDQDENGDDSDEDDTEDGTDPQTGTDSDGPPPADPPCDLTLGSRANMAHRHPRGSGGHTDCQHHTRPGCRPGLPTPWSPGAGHYDRIIDPCPLAAVTQVGLDPAELGKPGSITSGWNPLTTEVCGRYANQGMRPDTARRQCFSDYRIAAVEWDDDYDLHTALREAKAAGAPIDKSLWDLATQISRTLDNSGRFIVELAPGTHLVRLLPDWLEVYVCAGVAATATAIAVPSPDPSLPPRLAIAFGTGVAGAIYCRYVVDHD